MSTQKELSNDFFDWTIGKLRYVRASLDILANTGEEVYSEDIREFTGGMAGIMEEVIKRFENSYNTPSLNEIQTGKENSHGV